jgi:XTP/dITP diphosphohydrolase
MKTETIYYITGNQSKFREAKEIMKDVDIVLEQKDLLVNEVKSLDHEKVVLVKAREAFEKLQKPLIIDDVGIYFEEYNKFPGTFTKFLFEAVGFDGIERLLSGKNKNAYFRILLCYKDDKSEELFEGILKGRIVENTKELRNKDWQYDNVFIPEGFEISLSEIPLEERAKFSHRRKAFEKFIEYLGGRE